MLNKIELEIRNEYIIEEVEIAHIIEKMIECHFRWFKHV